MLIHKRKGERGLIQQALPISFALLDARQSGLVSGIKALPVHTNNVFGGSLVTPPTASAGALT